jgi:tRNA pseudouridine38-40 synthase
MVLAYDGTSFAGWQVQPNAVTIQGLIQDAIYTITKESVSVVGSGRTDAGVHAKGQVAHSRLSNYIAPEKLKRSLLGILPPTIRVLDLDIVSDTFHAQRSAIGKEYHYTMCLSDVVLPFDRFYVWHYRNPLDVDLLREGAKCFVGEHDFAAFANTLGAGCSLKTTVRTIYRLDVIQVGPLLRLEFEGNGFLYKMVRNITGMLVAVASGRRDLRDIQKVFLSKDRRQAERAAPPEGLFLIKVFYPDQFRSESTSPVGSRF